MLNKSIYLCGSMSGLKDRGSGWRKKITKWLVKHGESVYDPCVEELDELKNYGVKKKDRANWEAFPQELQEKIIRSDLEAISNCKYVICYYTGPSTGTVSELTYAFIKNIPIYFVSELAAIGWPETIMFSSQNKLFYSFEYLKFFLIEKIISMRLQDKVNKEKENREYEGFNQWAIVSRTLGKEIYAKSN